MRAAGIRELGSPVEVMELDDPRPLREDEVMIRVEAAGVGNWDDIVRAGGWDVGARPPMALGVEAAGTIVAIGASTDGWRVGDEVMTHPLPLREQGAWTGKLIAPAALIVRKPVNTSWAEAAAFPVPALTAHQVLEEAIGLHSGEALLVHGGGAVTGAIVVALGTLRGARVIATAGPASADRVKSLGADHVLDYHDAGWPDAVRELTGGIGVAAAVNVARDGEQHALRAVADGGRLATITGAPPEPVRGIAISNVYVRPDGAQLGELASLLGEGRVQVAIGATFGLQDAQAALRAAMAGGNGGAVVVTP